MQAAANRMLFTSRTGDSAVRRVLVQLLLNQRKHVGGQAAPTDVLRYDDGNVPNRLGVLLGVRAVGTGQGGFDLDPEELGIRPRR